MSPSTRLGTALAAVVLCVSLVACGEDDSALTADTGEPAVQTTDAPDGEAVEAPTLVTDRSMIDDAESLFASTVGSNYVVTFELISQVSAEAGSIRVVVADGRATNVTYPDTMTEQILPEIPLLTVTDFFNRARAVLSDGGDVEVEFDEFDGHPLTMTLDPIPEAIDDEMSIVVQSVEPLEVSYEPEGY